MLDAENVDPAESSASATGDPVATEQAGTGPGDSAPGSSPAESAGGGPAEADGGAEAGASPAKKATAKRASAKKATTKTTATKKTAAKRTTKKAAAAEAATPAEEAPPGSAAEALSGATPEAETPARETPPAGEGESAAAELRPTKKAAKKTSKAPAKRATKKAAGTPEAPEVATEMTAAGTAEPTAEVEEAQDAEASAGPPPATALLFQPPDPTKAVVTRRRKSAPAETAEAGAAEEGPREAAESQKPTKKGPKKSEKAEKPQKSEKPVEEPTSEPAEPEERGESEDEQGGERRRRRRGGRRRRRSGGGEGGEAGESAEGGDEQRAEKGAQGESEEAEESGTGTRRRRRRRRTGEPTEAGADEPENTVTKVRKSRTAEDEITALTGSTRLEAKKQRRREGREAGRRRAPIVSEAEFLARREAVDRVMVIRQRKDLTQIAVLEDKVLVEHYVSRESQTSLIGNVYLGRVQNVLPSMEAAFIDIGKGRNAVLYAGEVNWDALGAKNGTPRKIEAVLKSGQPILVQVTKDPIGHKGARLTSQISLPGRFLVYVPDGTTSGISRKLPDTERNRLKTLLKEIVPDTAGVIVRTAAEGASEEELTRDVERLTARWSDIEGKVAKGNAPQLLYGEPDLTLKVVRDLFTEDFTKLVIAGDDAWDMVDGYVSHVAPDLSDRLEKYDGQRDVFAEYRIDEQIEKALDRKVWLPSGGSLVIDRTEAMTVVDVNTGKFTGSGGNLEETVTKNNLEAAEEIVRQLRLRDIGGIIVVDFIDMVLESNRDLVLRRLVECLGRDRTRHQVAEVTSLGLVQMTRKRIGTGLLEAFSESCDHCQGRGLILHHEPVEPKKKGEEEPRRARRGGRGRGREESGGGNGGGVPSPKDVAAMARPEEQPEEKSAEPAEKGRTKPAEKGEPVEEGKGKAAENGEVTAPPAEAEPEPEPVEEKPTGRSRGRSRGGRGRGGKSTQAEAEQEGAAAGAAEPAAEEPRSEPAPEVERKGAEEAPAEAVTSEPAPPPAPKIVTSVRRRGARRAAGPPPGASAGAATTAGAPASAASGGESTAEEASEEPADSEPLATLLDSAELDVAEEAGSGPDGAESEVAEGTSSTPHVPVKKRGSRRR